MSSRSNIFSDPQTVVSIVPPTELVGGTISEHVLYHLYTALYYVGQIGSPRTGLIDQGIKLALRYVLPLHKRGRYFDKAGRIRRSSTRSTS